MIREGTKLQVTDNSGAKVAQCIRVLRQPIAYPGTFVVVSVQKSTPRPRVKATAGTVHHALVMETKTPRRQRNGFRCRGSRNTAVLVNQSHARLGTHIKGIGWLYLRNQKLGPILKATARKF